jgi:hypothetical protein
MGDVKMADATSTSSCCPQPIRKQKLVLKGKPLGRSWKKIIEEVLMKEGAKEAEAKQSSPETCCGPILFHLFTRKGSGIAADGNVKCACFITEDLCACYGQCDPDTCCGGPILKKG